MENGRYGGVGVSFPSPPLPPSAQGKRTTELQQRTRTEPNRTGSASAPPWLRCVPATREQTALWAGSGPISIRVYAQFRVFETESPFLRQGRIGSEAKRSEAKRSMGVRFSQSEPTLTSQRPLTFRANPWAAQALPNRRAAPNVRLRMEGGQKVGTAQRVKELSTRHVSHFRLCLAFRAPSSQGRAEGGKKVADTVRAGNTVTT